MKTERRESSSDNTNNFANPKLWEGNLWQTGVAWKDATRCGAAKFCVWCVRWELCLVSDHAKWLAKPFRCGRLRSKEICIDSLWAKIQVEPSCEESAGGFELKIAWPFVQTHYAVALFGRVAEWVLSPWFLWWKWVRNWADLCVKPLSRQLWLENSKAMANWSCEGEATDVKASSFESPQRII